MGGGRRAQKEEGGWLGSPWRAQMGGGGVGGVACGVEG